MKNVVMGGGDVNNPKGVLVGKVGQVVKVHGRMLLREKCVVFTCILELTMR